MTRLIVLIFLLALLLGAQKPAVEPEVPRLPDGRSQSEAILKEEHAKSLKDAAEILKLAEELKMELEKNDRHVLSVGALKKTDEIEKLVKRIRGRMRRF